MTTGVSTGIDIVTVDPRDIGEYREVRDHGEDIVDTYAVLYRRGLLNHNKLT